MSDQISAILDTNVWIAGLVFPRSMGSEILKLAERKRFQLWLPRVVRAEIEEVLKRDFPGFQGDITAAFGFAKELPTLPGTEHLAQVLQVVQDPKDAPILATVLEHEPDFFVTADIDHLHTLSVKKLLESRNIRLKTPYGFLKVLGKR